MWCWPQPLGQPLILTLTFWTSGSCVVELDHLLAHAVAGLVRGRDRELAAVGAGAGDDVGHAGRRRRRRSRSPSSSRWSIVQRLGAHPAQDQVLVLVGAGVAAGVLAHDAGQLAELAGADVAHRDRDRRRRRSRPASARATLVQRQRSKPAAAGLPSSATGALGVFRRHLGQRRHVDAAPSPSPSPALRRSSRVKASAPILCSRNLMRALLRFLRSRPGRSPSRSKTRRIASATRMYSPSSTRGELPDRVGQARHRRGAAADAHLEAAAPRCRWRPALLGDEAEVVEVGAGAVAAQLENEVLNLRGRRWQIGLRSMLRRVGHQVGRRVEHLVRRRCRRRGSR